MPRAGDRSHFHTDPVRLPSPAERAETRHFLDARGTWESSRFRGILNCHAHATGSHFITDPVELPSPKLFLLSSHTYVSQTPKKDASLLEALLNSMGWRRGTVYRSGLPAYFRSFGDFCHVVRDKLSRSTEMPEKRERTV